MKRLIQLIPYEHTLLVFAGSGDAFKKTLRNYKDISEQDIEKFANDLPTKDGTGRVILFPQAGLAMYFPVLKKTYHGLIAHESFHVAELLLGKLNMPLCDNNSEAYAYLIDYIVDKVMEGLK